LGEARRQLAAAAYDRAIAEADAGLSDSPDERTAWGLELVRLEAHARAGHGEQVVAELSSLSDRHPERVPATQFSAAADQLRAAGQGPASIQVLDLGLRRHPDDPVLARLIGASKSAGDVAPEELEMLRSLGYVQ
jgi:hypothetical protein